MPLSKPELYSKYIDKLRKESEKATIIVEGNRDEAKLRELGISGTILKIQGKRVAEWVESLPSEVIVMTDFDSQGARYMGQIKRLGERNGKKVNTELRVKIFSNTFARRVEELPFPESSFSESGQSDSLFPENPSEEPL